MSFKIVNTPFLIHTGLQAAIKGTVPKSAMTDGQWNATRAYLIKPFNQYVESADLNAALGKGYPRISATVSEDGRVLTIEASVDTKNDRGNLDPSDGYLTSVDKFIFTTDSLSGAPILVFHADAKCSDEDSLICRQFQGTLAEWGAQRLTENEEGARGVVKEFMGEEQSQLPIFSFKEFKKNQEKAQKEKEGQEWTGLQNGLKEAKDQLTQKEKVIKEWVGKTEKEVPTPLLVIGGGFGAIAIAGLILGLRSSFRRKKMMEGLKAANTKYRADSVSHHGGQIDLLRVAGVLGGDLQQILNGQRSFLGRFWDRIRKKKAPQTPPPPPGAVATPAQAAELVPPPLTKPAPEAAAPAPAPAATAQPTSDDPRATQNLKPAKKQPPPPPTSARVTSPERPAVRPPAEEPRGPLRAARAARDKAVERAFDGARTAPFDRAGTVRPEDDLVSDAPLVDPDDLAPTGTAPEEHDEFEDTPLPRPVPAEDTGETAAAPQAPEDDTEVTSVRVPRRPSTDRAGTALDIDSPLEELERNLPLLEAQLLELEEEVKELTAEVEPLRKTRDRRKKLLDKSRPSSNVVTEESEEAQKFLEQAEGALKGPEAALKEAEMKRDAVKATIELVRVQIFEKKKTLRREPPK